ncbi:MAG: arginine--tRNA ligase [Candidatus Aenigmarchaeota archaeon]|nr:arginine--tRNA ligase [Candidatus Aenigmarchaeota archaeon]
MEPFLKFRKECEKLCKPHGNLLEKPPKELSADLALPCFSLAKGLKKNPLDIAKGIAAKFGKGVYISRVEAEGAYVNFYADWKRLGKDVVLAASRKSFGSGARKKERVMVEFSQPNTHKGFHIGHLRNTCIGDSMARIMRFSGFEVISANYPGDIGAHVAKCLWLYMKQYRGKEPSSGRGRWLGEIYAEASQLLEKSSEYEKEYLEVLRRLYSCDSSIMPVWKKTREWSLEEFRNIYRELGVSFDVWFYESEVEKRGKDFALQALKRGIAKRSEGAIIFDLNDYGLDVLIVLRSDGTPLYSTKDLALAEMKFKQYKIDKSVHVVGSEQKLYFRQLFKALELLGFEQAKQCGHLSYELVMLKEGKMSSRAGNVILFEDIMEDAVEKAKKISADSAKEVALAALKYSMLSRDSSRVIVFDAEEALSFDGDTGPYLQYTYARARSILKKSKKKPSFRAAEEALPVTKKMSEFPSVIRHACDDMKPHYLANYLHELAAVFNEFYHANKVIGGGNEASLLAVIKSFSHVMKSGLSLLGIPVLERM